MKVVIFGGRDYTRYLDMAAHLNAALNQGFIQDAPDLTLLCGMARGADMAAHKLFMKSQLPIIEYPADWNKHGRSAGFIRNAEMARDCDVGIGFWDGQSRGTKHMIDTMQKLNKPLIIHRY